MGNKMTYTYCLRKSTVKDEERNPHTVYGVEAVSSGGEILLGFSDVFSDKQKAEHFIRLCNGGRLSLNHFADAVEDALAE